MPEPVYLSNKQNCKCVYEQCCKKDTKVIKHGDIVHVAINPSGNIIEELIVHKRCLNTHGKKYLQRKRPKKHLTIEKRQAQYTITHEHNAFEISSELKQQILEKHADTVTRTIRKRNIPLFDAKLDNAQEEIQEKHDIHVGRHKLVEWINEHENWQFPSPLVGKIVGETGTDRISFKIFDEIRQFDYVTICPTNQDIDAVLAMVDNVRITGNGVGYADAVIIGYRDNGMLKKIRQPVAPNNLIFKSTQDGIENLLELDAKGLTIGTMQNNKDVPIRIDPEDLFQHMAVVAKTGFGKSYSVGVLIEELEKKEIPTIVIDPHGEYHTLQQPNPDHPDVDNPKESDVGVSINHYATDTRLNKQAHQLTISTKNISYNNLRKLFGTGSLSTAQRREMRKIMRNLEEYEDQYNLDDIKRCVEEADLPKKTRFILLDKLQSLQRQNWISNSNGLSIDDLATPGEISVLNFKGTPPSVQQRIVSFIAEKLYNLVKYDHLPPSILIIEEAHNYAPSKGSKSTYCEDVLRTISQEGRKFGMGLGVISQRPGKINSDILSQTKLQLILRLNNNYDLKTVGKSFENVTKDVKNYIKSLPTGIGILLGKDLPIMVDVRQRRTKHGGESTTY